jgi:hypothetical protein
MLTIGLVILARRSVPTAAACLRNLRCLTAPTELLPSAAGVVLVRPPPALPNARGPCLLQCATARLSQKC